jgi:hypothetical protein
MKALKPTQSQREVSCMSLSPFEIGRGTQKSETHGTGFVSVVVSPSVRFTDRKAGKAWSPPS